MTNEGEENPYDVLSDDDEENPYDSLSADDNENPYDLLTEDIEENPYDMLGDDDADPGEPLPVPTLASQDLYAQAQAEKWLGDILTPIMGDPEPDIPTFFPVFEGADETERNISLYIAKHEWLTDEMADTLLDRYHFTSSKDFAGFVETMYRQQKAAKDIIDGKNIMSVAQKHTGEFMLNFATHGILSIVDEFAQMVKGFALLPKAVSEVTALYEGPDVDQRHPVIKKLMLDQFYEMDSASQIIGMRSLVNKYVKSKKEKLKVMAALKLITRPDIKTGFGPSSYWSMFTSGLQLNNISELKGKEEWGVRVDDAALNKAKEILIDQMKDWKMKTTKEQGMVKLLIDPIRNWALKAYDNPEWALTYGLGESFWNLMPIGKSLSKMGRRIKPRPKKMGMFQGLGKKGSWLVDIEGIDYKMSYKTLAMRAILGAGAKIAIETGEGVAYLNPVKSMKEMWRGIRSIYTAATGKQFMSRRFQVFSWIFKTGAQRLLEKGYGKVIELKDKYQTWFYQNRGDIMSAVDDLSDVAMKEHKVQTKAAGGMDMWIRTSSVGDFLKDTIDMLLNGKKYSKKGQGMMLDIMEELGIEFKEWKSAMGMSSKMERAYKKKALIEYGSEKYWLMSVMDDAKLAQDFKVKDLFDSIDKYMEELEAAIQDKETNALRQVVDDPGLSNKIVAEGIKVALTQNGKMGKLMGWAIDGADAFAGRLVKAKTAVMSNIKEMFQVKDPMMALEILDNRVGTLAQKIQKSKAKQKSAAASDIADLYITESMANIVRGALNADGVQVGQGITKIHAVELSSRIKLEVIDWLQQQMKDFDNKYLPEIRHNRHRLMRKDFFELAIEDGVVKGFDSIQQKFYKMLDDVMPNGVKDLTPDGLSTNLKMLEALRKEKTLQGKKIAKHKLNRKQRQKVLKVERYIANRVQPAMKRVTSIVNRHNKKFPNSVVTLSEALTRIPQRFQDLAGLRQVERAGPMYDKMYRQMENIKKVIDGTSKDNLLKRAYDLNVAVADMASSPFNFIKLYFDDIVQMIGEASSHRKKGFAKDMATKLKLKIHGTVNDWTAAVTDRMNKIIAHTDTIIDSLTGKDTLMVNDFLYHVYKDQSSPIHGELRKLMDEGQLHTLGVFALDNTPMTNIGRRLGMETLNQIFAPMRTMMVHIFNEAFVDGGLMGAGLLESKHIKNLTSYVPEMNKKWHDVTTEMYDKMAFKPGRRALKRFMEKTDSVPPGEVLLDLIGMYTLSMFEVTRDVALTRMNRAIWTEPTLAPHMFVKMSKEALDQRVKVGLGPKEGHVYMINRLGEMIELKEIKTKGRYKTTQENILSKTVGFGKHQRGYHKVMYEGPDGRYYTDVPESVQIMGKEVDAKTLYGDLAGKTLPEEVWHYMETFGSIFDKQNMGVTWVMLDYMTRAFKISKTALEPKTHATNIMTNYLISKIAGMDSKVLPGAIKSFKTGVEYVEMPHPITGRTTVSVTPYGIAKQTGLLDQSFVVQETGRIIDPAIKHPELMKFYQKINRPLHKRAMDKALWLPRKLMDLYGMEEAVFKASHAKHILNKFEDMAHRHGGRVDMDLKTYASQHYLDDGRINPLYEYWNKGRVEAKYTTFIDRLFGDKVGMPDMPTLLNHLVKHAENWYLNYADMPPWLKMMRGVPAMFAGNAFVSWSYGMFKTMWRWAHNNPVKAFGLYNMAKSLDQLQLWSDYTSSAIPFILATQKGRRMNMLVTIGDDVVKYKNEDVKAFDALNLGRFNFFALGAMGKDNVADVEFHIADWFQNISIGNRYDSPMFQIMQSMDPYSTNKYGDKSFMSILGETFLPSWFPGVGHYAKSAAETIGGKVDPRSVYRSPGQIFAAALAGVKFEKVFLEKAMERLSADYEKAIGKHKMVVKKEFEIIKASTWDDELKEKKRKEATIKFLKDTWTITKAMKFYRRLYNKAVNED